MKREVLGITMALLATLSCVKENEQELQPVDGGEERFAEFDPVVRFGLDTYMGGADDSEPLTKTTYAGDDKTIVLNKVRYERINWNGTSESNPDDPAYQDVIQIISQTNFTPKNDKPSVSYKVVAIPDWTNPSGNNREDYADAEPYSGSSDDYFYWSRPAGSKDTDKHYFYAVYPTSESDKRASTQVTSFSLNTSDSDPAKHFAKFSGYINKRVEPSPGENPGADADCRKQKYLAVESYTDSDSGKNCYEYLPDMKNAFLYAAAAMPGADAGYKKVPLRFKPLYSAVKIMVSAGDEGAKKYRLKRVDLRTDLHNNGSKDGRADLNPDKGTALGGSFSTYFKADATSSTTADFAKIDPSDTNTSLSDTLKRLFINVDPADYKVLGDNVLKFTFLVLPIEQRVMTVEYTFEYLKGSELDPSDPEYLDPAVDANWDDSSKIVEVHRYLSLQQKTTKADNTGTHNEFSDNGWFKLPAATKLYVKSNVPEIQYYFDVVMQGNLPRTWKAGSTKPAGKDFFEAKDFYAVISYRDSTGFLQPLRWKVTKYKPEGGSWQDAPPSWLKLRGDDPWTKLVPFDVDESEHPGAPYSGFDPWDVVQGRGTRMKNPVDKDNNPVSEGSRELVGYQSIDLHDYTFYDAGAPDNGSRSWGWVNHGSYIHSTPDGEFVHHDNDGVAFPDSTGLKGWMRVNGEAYAYDLSSHDIYGNLTANFNGDIANATTANCYVVSAPGWYRFPAVYGNALKGGIDNDKAYNKGVPNTTNGIMGAFLDHTGTGIEDPWITYKYTITSVDIVWDDANRMVSTREDTPTRMDRRPFCKTIGGYPYIYFYVDDIAQGNALIAAKSGNDIVWSWHIWAVTNPDEYLKTIELQSNQEIPSDPLEYTPFVTFINSKKEIRHNEDLNKARPSCVPNFFWQRADLGQNGKENKVDARYCDVEFSQYFKGKVVQKVVRRVLQSGVKDDFTNAPCYQWGRKDPIHVAFLEKKPIPTDTSEENTDITIKEPTSFFIGENTYFPTGKRYDNLWNTNVDAVVTNSYADGRDGGSKDRSVQKTIYDPSPVGFVVPNMYAFSGLNPFGPISQIRFPYDLADSIADDHINSYKNKKYIDFYSDYDPSETWLRKIDATKTIRLFMTGRIKGSGKVTDEDAGKYHNLKGAYYWLSEPGMTEPNHFFGRSLTLDSDNYAVPYNPSDPNKASGIRLWPVAGTPRYEKVNSSGEGTGTYRDAQGKWQRSHANPVRPMVEQP